MTDPRKERWAPTYYATVTNNRGHKIDMFIVFDGPGIGDQTVTIGVPSGRGDIAAHIAELHNRNLTGA